MWCQAPGVSGATFRRTKLWGAATVSMAFLFDHWSSREVGTRGCGESSRGVNLLARHLLSPQGCADAGRRYPRLCARQMGGIIISVAKVNEIHVASHVDFEDTGRHSG